MSDYSSSINRQYSQSKLYDRILDAFRNEGINVDALTLDDLSRFDQLHAGGQEATRVLAKLAGLKPGMAVIDIGSGVGGPARTLAAEFGCHVVGIDITEEYVNTAKLLSEKVGLSKLVSFIEGNALQLDFYNETFDAVWSQNVIMNIEDKYRLFQEAHRVLRSNGILAIEALMAGTRGETRFPVFWADSPDVSFMITPDSFRKMMTEIGFLERVWEDVTLKAIDGNSKHQAFPRYSHDRVGLHILYTDVPRKAENTNRGLQDGTYVYVYAIYERIS